MPIYLASFSDKSTLKRNTSRIYEYGFRCWDKNGRIICSGMSKTVLLAENYIRNNARSFEGDYRQEIVTLKTLPELPVHKWRVLRRNTDTGAESFVKGGQKRFMRFETKAAAERHASHLNDTMDHRNGNFEYTATDKED